MRKLTALVLLAAGCAGPAPARPAPAGPVDWDAEAAAATALLQKLVQLDTINPPADPAKPNADETSLLRWVAAELASDGIESTILESAPGRGNLVARLRGERPGKGLLLMAHVDVVSVDRTKWLVDPLSGTIRDGFLWGRGALDDKGSIMCFMQAMRLAKRRGLPLKRDLVLMLNADEESSGRFGAEFMVKNHWDLIDCDAAINEGGRVRLENGRVTSVGIQSAEKIYNDIKLWVRGESGHSSAPRRDNAIYSAARYLAALDGFQFPVRITPTAAQALELMAAKEKPEVASLIRRVAKGDAAAAEELAPLDPKFNLQLRSTFVPTIVQGGIRANVLPPDVLVNFNLRLLPGEKLDDAIHVLAERAGIGRFAIVEPAPDETWEARWKAWLEEQEAHRIAGRAEKLYNVAVLVADRGVDAPASPLDTPVYNAIKSVARELEPEALVGPMMSGGATDSRFLRLRGVPAYGLLPLPIAQAESDSVHNHNEKVPIASIGYGVKMTWRIIEEYNK